MSRKDPRSWTVPQQLIDSCLARLTDLERRVEGRRGKGRQVDRGSCRSPRREYARALHPIFYNSSPDHFALAPFTEHHFGPSTVQRERQRGLPSLRLGDQGRAHPTMEHHHQSSHQGRAQTSLLLFARILDGKPDQTISDGS